MVLLFSLTYWCRSWHSYFWTASLASSFFNHSSILFSSCCCISAEFSHRFSSRLSWVFFTLLSVILNSSFVRTWLISASVKVFQKSSLRWLWRDSLSMIDEFLILAFHLSKVEAILVLLTVTPWSRCNIAAMSRVNFFSSTYLRIFVWWGFRSMAGGMRDCWIKSVEKRCKLKKLNWR